MSKKPHFIREWRKARRLTLEQLAERVDMTHQNLGKIERFKVPYNQHLLERLAEVLDTDPGSLVMRDPSQNEALWNIYDKLTLPQRDQGVAILQALLSVKTGEGNL